MATEPPLTAVLAAWLLWCRCPKAGGWPTPRDEVPSPLLATGGLSPKTDVPEDCSVESDCGDTANVVCDNETSRCVCRDVYSVLSPTGACLPVKQLGEACTFNAQCEYFDRHAACLEGTCACSSGFYTLPDRNGSLCDSGGGLLPGSPTEATLSSMDINMIIIVVCLAFMFLGICVALHLFSKARFRNRRTIFNSPHPRLMHIKLGRKKPQRRPSHINVPPTSRHHSFSVYQSPLPSRPVHKTMSHECLRSTSPMFPKFYPPKANEAPLAEKESLPSTEDLAKKAPEMKNGPAILKASAAMQNGPSSPTVIVTDADGSHTVVSSKSPSPPLNV